MNSSVRFPVNSYSFWSMCIQRFGQYVLILVNVYSKVWSICTHFGQCVFKGLVNMYSFWSIRTHVMVNSYSFWSIHTHLVQFVLTLKLGRNVQNEHELTKISTKWLNLTR